MKLILTLIAIFVFLTGYGQSDLSIKRVTVTVDGYPTLSPDGMTILFESDRTGNSEIYTMNVNGTGITQLTFNDSNDDSPIWSPDGKLIAFASVRDGDSEIYVMDSNGQNQKRLTKSPGDDSHPKFSPDGRRIIFNSARTTGDVSIDWGKQTHEIFSMSIDGSDVRQLTQNNTVTTYASFSPDGKKIVFRKVIDGSGFNWDLTTHTRNSEVFVLDIASGEQINLSNSPAYDGWPVWTPDGRIVFASNRNGIPSRSALYIVNANGTGLKQITDSKYSYNQHSISPDGKFILAERNAESFAGIDMIEFKE